MLFCQTYSVIWKLTKSWVTDVHRIVYCVVTNVMQIKVDAIEQFIVSSSVYVHVCISFVHAQSQDLPNKG